MVRLAVSRASRQRWPQSSTHSLLNIPVPLCTLWYEFLGPMLCRAHPRHETDTASQPLCREDWHRLVHAPAGGVLPVGALKYSDLLRRFQDVCGLIFRQVRHSDVERRQRSSKALKSAGDAPAGPLTRQTITLLRIVHDGTARVRAVYDLARVSPPRQFVQQVSLTHLRVSGHRPADWPSTVVRAWGKRRTQVVVSP